VSDDLFDELGIQSSSKPSSSPQQPEGRAPSRKALRKSKRKRRFRRRIIATLVLVLTLGLVTGAGYYAFTQIVPAQEVATDYTGPGEGSIVVTIPDGATGNEMADILVKKGVVASKKAFVKAYNANTNSSQIQSGTFTLKKRMSATDAVAALLDPRSRADHTVTIPEGFTKAQVKARLVKVAGFKAEDVEAAFANTKDIGLPDSAGGNVEGWLAPATYTIPDNATATGVVASMVQKTKDRLKEAGVKEADYQQVLIVASIAEAEVNDPSYLGKVSRVIYNRLNDTAGETKGMLQMDSTVRYGTGKTGGIPTDAELADSNNKWNTYVHAGLPPSPIGNPGLEAIKAANKPEAGNWLYFVTINLTTGETLFAATSAEHQVNVAKLTAFCKQNPKVCSSGSSGS
jgi:hypothetical protein